MRHRILVSVFAVLLGLALWPTDALAQQRSRGRSTSEGRAVSARRPVRVNRPIYPGRYYYRPYYYRSYYRPYYWSAYWGWGYPWYSSPYYGWYDPFWHPYGTWGHRYYDDNAAVRVQASPREAKVYVDGYYVGIVDDFDGMTQRLRLPPGGHELTLHLPGYRNASEKIYLQPNSTYRFRARLEPLPTGAPQDPPPAPNPEALQSDERERYDEARERGRVEQDEPEGPPSRRWPPRQQAEERQAAQARDARFGTLAIRVQPPDAQVLVDGTPWGGAADQDGTLDIQVPAGLHRIEIRRDGYDTFTTEITVRAGAATPLNVLLQREN